MIYWTTEVFGTEDNPNLIVIFVDNSTTSHILNTISLFKGSLTSSTSRLMTVHGLGQLLLKGKVPISLHDNDGTIFPHNCKDVYFCPSSLVNILYVTKLRKN